MRIMMKKFFLLLCLVGPAFADIAVTPGSGKTVATVTTGGREYQQISASIDGSSNTIQGATASGSTDAGNPVKTGGKATITNPPTKVSDGQDVNGYYGANGSDIPQLDCPRELVVKSSITITTDTTERVILSSGAAGVFNDLDTLFVNNTSASAVRVDFRSLGLGAQAIDFATYVPAGTTWGFANPHPWPQTTAANNWTAQCSASVTDVRIYGRFCKTK